MSRGVRRFFLISYFLAITAGFAYFLFPSKAIVDFVTVQSQRAFPDFNVTIQEAKPGFPPGLILQGVEVRHGETPVVQLERIRLAPTLGSLFKAEKIIRISAELLGGQMNGELLSTRTGEAKGSDWGIIPKSWRFGGIDISRIPALKQIFGLDLTGSLAGAFTTEAGAAGLTISGESAVSNLRAGFLKPIFGIEALEWKEVKSEFNWKGRQLDLKKCEAAGPQTDVILSGKVEWKNTVQQSVLSIEGVIKPQPEFMASLTKTIPAALIPKKATGKEGIPIKIKGTVGAPDVSFK